MSCTIEHWRDGERVAVFDLTKQNIVRENGIARIALPPGSITLTTNDELRFDPQGLIDLCQRYV
jgi:hypothetical protein